ncbi:unnamed protein product, partial [Linum tenue]
AESQQQASRPEAGRCKDGVRQRRQKGGEVLALRGEAARVLRSERVPAAVQAGVRLPEENRRLRGQHLRLFCKIRRRQRAGEIVVREAGGGAREMHFELLCFPLEPRPFPSLSGDERSIAEEAEAQKRYNGCHKVDTA